MSELILPPPAAWLMIGALLAGETYEQVHGYRGTRYITSSGIRITAEMWPMGPVMGTRLTISEVAR